MAQPKTDIDRARYNNLFALVGSVTRCLCGKQGYLVKVGVKAEARFRKRIYFGEWEHPDPLDPESAEVCEYFWP